MNKSRYDYDESNLRFRDEFGVVNDLLTGESYICGESLFLGERDQFEEAIALCNLLNKLHNDNIHLEKYNKYLINLLKKNHIQVKSFEWGG